MRSKKGQMSDTVTWMVATIIILVVLMFFLVGASLLSDTKKIQKYKPTLTSINFVYEDVDPYLSKSIYTYEQIGEGGDKAGFYQILAKQEEGGNFLEPLGERVKEVEKKLKMKK